MIPSIIIDLPTTEKKQMDEKQAFKVMTNFNSNKDNKELESNYVLANHTMGSKYVYAIIAKRGKTRMSHSPFLFFIILSTKFISSNERTIYNVNSAITVHFCDSVLNQLSPTKKKSEIALPEQI